jgi:hypothetical protein
MIWIINPLNQEAPHTDYLIPSSLQLFNPPWPSTFDILWPWRMIYLIYFSLLKCLNCVYINQLIRICKMEKCPSLLLLVIDYNPKNTFSFSSQNVRFIKKNFEILSFFLLCKSSLSAVRILCGVNFSMEFNN